jgi:hypothetical protein
MRAKINEKMREALKNMNGGAADGIADLLARASERVDEAEAREAALSALNVLSFLPGVAALSVNLALDSRVPFIKKFQLGIIIAYLVSPGEALINALAGPVAYLDDAVLILYIVFLVAQMVGSLGEDVIRDNWIGDPAQADELVKAADALGKFLGMRISAIQAGGDTAAVARAD